jgi:uncharacterized protein (UPF0333 family)
MKVLMNKMKVKLFAILFLILFLFLSGTSFGESELEWITAYEIEIGENGSARWIIERRTLLETEYDKATFNYYSSPDYHYELSKNISELVRTARLKTGRWNMTYEDLKITSTFAVTYGVVTYQYEWLEFASLAPSQERIEIGDVFVDGIFLFGNGELTVQYPSGYIVAEILPISDETEESDRTIVWYELENFSTEEPKIVLRKKGLMDILHEYMLLIGGVVAVASVTFASFWLFRFRKKGDTKPVVQSERPTLETEDDEEKVIRLLKASHGSLYQVTITEKCGFSKTKTSLLLATMEKKGIVKRKKKGRKKLVTLIENASLQPETKEKT